MDRVSIFDRLFARVTVGSSSISKQTGQPLYDLSGVGFPDDEPDSRGESKNAQEGFTAGGVLFRPPPPEGRQDDLFTEALAVRTSDGLVPLAFRDRRIIERINRAHPTPSKAPKEGQMMYAGYGGAFLSYELKGSGAELRDQTQLYVPYARDGQGVPTKAHSITLGKDESGKVLLSIISGDGPRLMLIDDKATLSNADGSSWVEVGPAGVTCVGNFKVHGGADLGGTASAPLAKSAELITWAGLVTTWQAQVTAAVNGLAPGSITAPTTALSASVATALTKGG